MINEKIIWNVIQMDSWAVKKSATDDTFYYSVYGKYQVKQYQTGVSANYESGKNFSVLRWNLRQHMSSAVDAKLQRKSREEIAIT